MRPWLRRIERSAHRVKDQLALRRGDEGGTNTKGDDDDIRQDPDEVDETTELTWSAWEENSDL